MSKKLYLMLLSNLPRKDKAKRRWEKDLSVVFHMMIGID